MKYNEEDGYERMQFDMGVAATISERIKQQTDASKGKADAKAAVARRNQKRKERATINNKEMGNVLKNWVSE